MFKRQLTFRRKADDQDGAVEEGGSDADNRRRESLMSSDGLSRQSHGRSETGFSTANSIDRQLTTSANPRTASSRDPIGLKVVYRPPGDRKVDVVFVHGLGGSSRMTWSHDRNLDLFWPLTFLPLEPAINEARILTFGYNSNFGPGSGRNKMSILDFAKDLLYDLKYAQDEAMPEVEGLGMGERPIIFTVHSMGGLIVKEAYMQGQYDPTYKSIIKAVSSIIFLSTPHRGTNLAETLNRILQVSFITSPMQFIAELAAGSQTMQKLNEQFRHVAPKLQIVSFYETRPTAMFKKSQIMVLEKDSSVLGYPGEISKPLDADHHGVCKYPHSGDPRYIAVRNVLRTLIGNVKSKNESPVIDDRKSTIAYLGEYLSISESPDADYNFFRDRWTPGTCSWIIENESFTEWAYDTRLDPRVLWVSSNAASGKSILSSFVINHLVQSGLPCHYFFIRFMSQEKRGISMLLRSLAWQLANSTTEYADKLRQLEAAATNLKTADYRNLWQWLFKQTLFQLDLDYPLYWVIDGVDEADRPGSVIKLLSELYLTRIPLRVLLVSRKTHSISSAFQKLAKQVHMETIHTEGNIHDFRAYIDHEMDLAGDDSYREAVTAQLLDRANGNFLWIHLAVQKINSCHTKPDVENALNDLPSGMDPLYNRMALSVLSQSNPSDRSLGERILGWATCARRLLTVDELRDALGNDGVLEIHRTIADLCGGFLTVDHEGRVAMIHETARGYLTGGSEKGQPLVIDSKATNYMLFKRCIARLTDPTLRSQINRNRPPALLAYATTTWFDHFVHAWANSPEILEMVVNFLRGPHVLTWIHVAARAKELRALILASRCLTDVVAKLRRMNEEEKTDADRPSALLIEGWATDLVKIVGKFGNNLRQQPNSIYKLIPPFCPEESLIYQQFGRKEARALHVSGFSSGAWDDCLARFCMEEGVVASSVIAAGSRIAVLAVIRKTSQVIIYNSATFEEQRRITHPERVLSIQADKLGRLVSYGYLTTRIWDTATGECLRVIKNPRKRPRPHSILADEKNNTVLVCGEDRCVRSFSLDNDLEEVWSIHSQIEEETLDHTTVNFPVCSALSPDGNMIAFGYRNHPLTAWELDPPMLVGQCHVRLDATDRTIEDKTFGEVYRVAWHPFSGEIFGLTMVGLLFRWDPYEEETSATVHSGADCLTVSWDGSLIATGDAVGTIKIYATADFSVLYQLASQDPVHHLSFSSDSRQLYDVRGSYGNVWEPNTLVRLAESQDHNSDTHSETDSVSKYSLHTEHHVARIDRVVALAGQSVGPLYCYGTEDGVAILCEAGRGKVCELERLMSYMSIEQISWSEDGRLIALADLSRRIRLKSVVRSSENRDSWQVIPQFDLVIPLEKGHIRQLLFHPAGRKLLASTPTTLFSLDLESRALTESTLESALSKVTWTCHPTLPDALLGFGKTEVVVFSWNDLSQIEVHEYFPSRVSHPSPTFGLSRSFQKDTENLGRVISSIDSPLVLLELSHSGASGQIEGEYLLFDLGDMHVGTSSDGTSPGSKTIPYTLVPQHIASRIREPLAFLSRRRLVFLDVDRWICSWRLPGSGPARAQGRKGSETGTAEIEQYYFLPGDWVTSNETRLCTVTPDGTLLCPRNGDVATVQAAKLRK